MALSSEWALAGPDFTPSPTLGLDHPLPSLPCMAAKLNTRLFTRDENDNLICIKTDTEIQDLLRRFHLHHGLYMLHTFKTTQQVQNTVVAQ